MRLLFAGCSLLAMGAVALAHQSPKGWEYPYECCHDKDCEQVHLQSDKTGDYVVTKDGRRWNIHPKQETRPSLDQDYHICIYANQIRCWFVPAGA